MRIVSDDELRSRLGSIAVDEPRVVASGNFATPLHLLGLVDGSLERYRLFMLNAALGCPSATASCFETPFVGPGMRKRRPQLAYVPMRLSLVPHLFRRALPAGRRDRPDLADPLGPCLARDRGQHPSRRDRAGSRARRPGHCADQSADALQLRRRGAGLRADRLCDRGRAGPPLARYARAQRGRAADR